MAAARAAGANDVEVHDTVLIAALFCLYNRYVDGLAAPPPSDPSTYDVIAEQIVTRGYVPATDDEPTVPIAVDLAFAGG